MAKVTAGYSPEEKAKADAGGGRPMEDGWYVLLVKSATVESAKKADAYPNVVLKCEVQQSHNGKHVGGVVTRRFNLHPKSVPYNLIPFIKAIGAPMQIVLERRPFEQLHHDVGTSVGDVEIEDLHDVRVAHGCDGLRLGPEAIQRHLFFGEMAVENLDGDGAIERRVMTQVHLGHAAPAQALLNLYFGERASDPVFHVYG